jgi:hypothetical protein
MASHSWERAHTFAAPLAPDAGWQSDSDSDGVPSKIEAGAEFMSILLDLKASGKLSARDICVLAFYAKHAGLDSPATKLALGPHSPTGHYQRHIDRVLGLNTRLVEDEYLLPVPSFDKHALSRIVVDCPALPPHESLEAEIRGCPSLRGDLATAVDAGDWHDLYIQHEVVRSAPPGAPVYPLALYVDAVPFQRRDSAVAFYVYNLVSNTRHLSVVVRRSQLCRCGCLGWCTLHPIMQFLAWSFTALAKGQWPVARHDGAAFHEAEPARSSRAGQDLPRGALVHIKADWAEFVHTFGLASWSSSLHPCFCCVASKEDMDCVGAFSPISGPFAPKTAATYEAACSSCERVVLIADAHTHALVLGALHWDKKKGGSRGRALTRDLPGLSLLLGDRLEPGPLLWDVGKFEDIPIPSRVAFWRPSNATMAMHRNPVLSGIPGVTVKHIALDTLHCLHLGVFKEFAMAAIWSLLNHDVWSVGGPDQDARLQLSVQRCRLDLQAWYKAQRRLRPDETLYELQDLTLAMLGTPTKPCLATKGAETGTLIAFCTDAVTAHASKLGDVGPALAAVGSALVALRDVLRASPRVMDATTLQRLCDLAKRAFCLREAAQVRHTPT